MTRDNINNGQNKMQRKWTYSKLNICKLLNKKKTIKA